MIVVVSYGLGNVQAFLNVYRWLNIPAIAATTAEELSRAKKVILPGVGTFDWAITCLNESGLRPCLDDLVVRQGCPVLGICVGMQILGRRSDEGVLDGLGWVDGEVKKLDEHDPARGLRLPHMGWNDVSLTQHDSLFSKLEMNAKFYFLHSYYFAPGSQTTVLASTDYCRPFASSVRSGNIYGVQFHPEKSHGWGVQILKNFAEL